MIIQLIFLLFSLFSSLMGMILLWKSKKQNEENTIVSKPRKEIINVKDIFSEIDKKFTEEKIKLRGDFWKIIKKGKKQ